MFKQRAWTDDHDVFLHRVLKHRQVCLYGGKKGRLDRHQHEDEVQGLEIIDALAIFLRSAGDVRAAPRGHVLRRVVGAMVQDLRHRKNMLPDCFQPPAIRGTMAPGDDSHDQRNKNRFSIPTLRR